MTLKQKQSRLKTVVSLLLKRYPMPQAPTEEKLNLLQLVALGAVSDDPYAPAALQLIRRMEKDYVDWNEIRVTSTYELDEIFGAYHLDPRHATMLKNVLQLIFEQENRLTPDLTSDEEPETIKAYLSGYKDFPRAVQDTVLLLLDGGKDIPISETVLRFTSRIGVAAADSSVNSVQLLYRKVSAGKSSRVAHYAICCHCRELCREKPLCKKCFLVTHCDYGTKQVSGKPAKAATE